MNVTRYESPEAFLQDNLAFLNKERQMNNLMLGLLERIKTEGHGAADLFLRIDAETGRLVAMMSGLHIILYSDKVEATLYGNLVAYLLAEAIEFPGIIGPVACCEAFKAVYERKTGRTLVKKQSQRIYVIKKIKERVPLSGRLIQAKPEQEAFLLPWLHDFHRAAAEELTIEQAQASLKRLLARGSLYLYEHQGKFVSMAAGIRPFDNTISIGVVYTPAKLRRRGYGRKCTELLTEKLLKSYDYCTLYTDLDNPISNSIYQKIGYEPVGDSCVYMKQA